MPDAKSALIRKDNRRSLGEFCRKDRQAEIDIPKQPCKFFQAHRPYV